MKKTPFENFGSKLFNEDVMSLYLPRPIFIKWKNSVSREVPMDRESADAIAHAMKVWALENGATHYCHWFQPMTGASAEKHDAFLEPDDSGKPITRFSGSNLIKGETDGSSFPNGGLRQTFEARGYTYWDVSSPVFVRGHVLFIPSIFISYNGESLDEKAPLLKSMEALNKHATRVVNALGDKSVHGVKAMVGLEQEYFLIDKDTYTKRDDLLYTGRTLVGAQPPKGQELESHYFGEITSKVIHYMEDVNEELWTIGIYSKVEHNEVAPSQFEISAVYSDANIAIDQNMLVMQTLQRVALKHGLVALLYEKPFSYINGSGKHNNFSLVTDTGHNLFDPGDRPHENIRFLLFACALLKAVDKHATLLRYAASGPGNDHRLGAAEAPPAIISVYIGNVLEELFAQLESSKTISLSKEVQYFSPLVSLSESPKDYSDRNRTSPFAFTGNKFEFRMLGSSVNPSFSNTVLCSIMAETLEEVAGELEEYKYVHEAREHALEICQRIIKAHKRVIFNGDGYHESWVTEAEKRGLPNIISYIKSAASLLDDATVSMFEKTGVLTKVELEARSDVTKGRFIETIETEVMTLLTMVKRQIVPAAMKEIRQAVRTINSIQVESNYLLKHQESLVTTLDELDSALQKCESTLADAHHIEDLTDKAIHMQDVVRPTIAEIRELCDRLESIIPADVYPLPTYTELLFIK